MITATKLEDIDSVSKNIPDRLDLPRNAELIMAMGAYQLYKMKDYPLAFQVWSKDTYVAGFTDQARAEIYLRARS